MSKPKKKYIRLKFSNGETSVESDWKTATDIEVAAAQAFWTRLITGKWPKELP